VIACGAMDAWCSILGDARDPAVILKVAVEGVVCAHRRDVQTGGKVYIATTQRGVIDGPRWIAP
jgi:hypothetical protein